MSAYNAQIPQSNDDPKVSQSQILGNFSKLNADFDIDHRPFTSSTNSGFHRKITFQDVLVGNPGLSEPLSSLYTKLVSSNPELFFQNNSADSDAFQLTNLTVTSTANVDGVDYQVITPWNLKIQMGFSASPITFDNGGFDGPLLIFSALVSGGTAINPIVTGVTTTQLTFTDSGGSTVHYFVIGLP